MEDQKTSEMERAEKLEQARLEKQQQLENEKSVRDKHLQRGDFRRFTRQGIAEGRERRERDINMPQKGLAGSPKGRIKNAKNIAKTGKAALTAVTEIDASKDASYFFVIALSVLADLFSVVPILGSIMAFLFAILIWLVYLISGHFKLKSTQQTISLVVAALFELIPGINFLPFFTASAIVNYWIALAARKAEKQKNV